MAVFDEPLLGQSALDRFCHRAHQFVIEGESYRKRTAPRSGVHAPNRSENHDLNKGGGREDASTAI